MRMVLAATVLALSSLAYGVEYKTQFENPIKDDRIVFQTCAVEGALYGIATGDLKAVACFGTVKDLMIPVLVAQGNEPGELKYYLLGPKKKSRSLGETDDSGMSVETYSIKALNADLKSIVDNSTSTIQLRQEYMMSEGGYTLLGKLPGINRTWDAPIFDLEFVDSELKDFISEID